MDLTKTGKRIKLQREKLGLTGTELAERLDGYTSENGKSKISRWENGAKKKSPLVPPIHEIQKLADIFGCDPEYLLGCVDHPTVTTSWIAEQIPLIGRTIDELVALKKECSDHADLDAIQSDSQMTALLADCVVAHTICSQDSGGFNETLLSLVRRWIEALKVLAEYDAVHMKDDQFFRGDKYYSIEEWTELQANPPERYRMAKWESEMYKSKIGELFADVICDTLQLYTHCGITLTNYIK